MLQVKWAQLNKAVGNLQSSPNMWVLNWLGFCIGGFQKIQIFGITDLRVSATVGVVIPDFCPLLHNSFTRLCLILQLFLPEGSSCLASDYSLSSFTQELLFFFSVKGGVLDLHFYVWMDFCWPGCWVKNLWNSCHSLVQLVEAWISPSLPYLKALETEKAKWLFFHYKVLWFKNIVCGQVIIRQNLRQ